MTNSVIIITGNISNMTMVMIYGVIIFFFVLCLFGEKLIMSYVFFVVEYLI